MLRYARARDALRDVLRMRPGLLPPHIARFADDPPWPTPDDDMLTVFVVDALAAALNFACVVHTYFDQITFATVAPAVGLLALVGLGSARLRARVAPAAARKERAQ